MNPLPFSLDHIEEDPRTAHLALHAAKSLHQTQGVQFDDSYRISLHEDLQISVVELKLPLGCKYLDAVIGRQPGHFLTHFSFRFLCEVIFLENEGGCFVTKVAPDGSAARSGGVEIGDQLAAINGESCARMKVDDICDAISRSPTTTCIETVFLRYIGPFRPSRHLQMCAGGPSFDLDITGCALSRPEMESHSSGQDKKKGFRIFGRGRKKRDGSKK
jgi:hypothetical protein